MKRHQIGMKKIMNEERWIAPGSKCDLCQRAKREDERWWDTHTSSGLSGFTFNFCTECERDRQSECDEVMGKVLSDHRERTREYWATHPEEKAEYLREIEEYRKTLEPDGLPKSVKRSWWKRVWNWLRKIFKGF